MVFWQSSIGKNEVLVGKLLLFIEQYYIGAKCYSKNFTLNSESPQKLCDHHLQSTNKETGTQVLTSWLSFAPDLKTLQRKEKLVISEHLDVRCGKHPIQITLSGLT